MRAWFIATGALSWPRSTNIKNEWSFTATPRIHIHGMALRHILLSATSLDFLCGQHMPLNNVMCRVTATTYLRDKGGSP
jgi:hypothetical protein